MGYNNYWLNLIQIDELINKLNHLYKPLFSKKWHSDIGIEADLFYIKNNFFMKNKNYLKYEKDISIKFFIKIQNNYYILDNILIERIV